MLENRIELCDDRDATVNRISTKCYKQGSIRDWVEMINRESCKRLKSDNIDK